MRDSRGAEFDEFVRTRSVALLRVAYLLTGDRHATEDLLQEVLEQLYVRWRRVGISPDAYARRALVDRPINRWRRRARRPEQTLGNYDVVARDHADDVADQLRTGRRTTCELRWRAPQKGTTPVGGRRGSSKVRLRGGRAEPLSGHGGCNR
ncbi:sigma factor [Micromonospora sp. LH3U1]|uniref:sigma factor n=1 Tax=Micromonospora sp. LH3U1 TaxID=3018339 RepID=UPI00234AB750|nr:sigma factor [Micromonospora sp. LH3U1]WCN81934.1 sigma factor [Micromonospora sp. LH3U1]